MRTSYRITNPMDFQSKPSFCLVTTFVNSWFKLHIFLVTIHGNVAAHPPIFDHSGQDLSPGLGAEGSKFESAAWTLVEEGFRDKFAFNYERNQRKSRYYILGDSLNVYQDS
ncbi:hypothetical protein PsorP6_003260 [Peronosclerospora sorghi]|uniref:Uncharacterized protein n=1 Tax=Peronosclerospora sorghi TaxID=230839 RepID=A0ACC0VMK5_9STRA|nr:hypothetical protein PsorP6_003260 [Peronosclerospora sorghi]